MSRQYSGRFRLSVFRTHLAFQIYIIIPLPPNLCLSLFRKCFLSLHSGLGLCFLSLNSPSWLQFQLNLWYLWHSICRYTFTFQLIDYFAPDQIVKHLPFHLFFCLKKCSLILFNTDFCSLFSKSSYISLCNIVFFTCKNYVSQNL